MRRAVDIRIFGFPDPVLMRRSTPKTALSLWEKDLLI
jgi:hypothetical protein